MSATATPDTPLEAALRANGMVHPQIQNQCSAATGCSLASTCAMLEMESGGGNNVFGHDGGNPIQGGQVTEQRYKLLRQYITEGHPSNGVGPCQLTSVSLLDEADQAGGAWTVQANMMTGFAFLRQLQAEFGTQGGFEHYNGSGPAAVAYGVRAMALQEKWQALINSVLEPQGVAGTAPPAASSVPAAG